MRTEAQKRADARYNQKVRQILLKVNPETEADISRKLEDTANVSQYIKNLILRDIAAEIASRRPMADHPEDAWHKEAEVPASPAQMATRNGRRQALEGYADYFRDMTDEDIDEEIRQGFIQICSDGMILWYDGK